MRFPVKAAAALLALAALPALATDRPAVANWNVPGGGTGVLADITNPAPFIGVTPCRIVDTRGNGAPITGGPFTAGQARTYTLAGVCGLPASGMQAVSLNVTVTDTQGAGFIQVYPTGNAATVSTLNFVAGQTIANAAIVPVDAQGRITVVAGVSGTNLIIDTNGYFTGALANKQLSISTIFDGAAAIVGFNYSNVNGSHGLGGFAGGTGTVHGVQGQIGSSAGTFASGVHGIAESRTKNFGVVGDVVGYNGGTYFGTSLGAGVMGRGTKTGVVGYVNPPATGTNSSGTSGSVLSAGGVTDVSGTLGVAWETTGEKYGVYYSGGLGGFGTKSFIEPHPTDPERVIRYYAMEGPESGTYFRGSAETRNGVATIDVPETFRMVSAAEGVTVQITPTGSDFVQVRVEKKGLDTIVVRASKETTFDYLVQGVRRAYKDAEVTPRSWALRPESPDARIPEWLSPDEKQRVIQSGIYNPDGSVNLDTARRLGWTRVWEAEGVSTVAP